MGSKLKPRFISIRNDGLGTRLLPLLNAVAMAHECGGEFEFSWSDNDDTGSGEAMLPVEDIFSQSFIDRHLRNGWLDLFDCQRWAGVKYQNFISYRLKNPEVRYLVKTGASDRICHVATIDDIRSEMDHPGAADIYRNAFDVLEFSDDIRVAIRAANCVRLPESTTALHLRAGDIVETIHRFTGRFTRRVLPFPLASALVKKERELGRGVVIFGQDPMVVQHICGSTGALSATELVLGQSFTDTQMWFFETCLMARCQRIISGGTSAFSQLASRIGNIKNISGYNLSDGATALDLILSNETETAPVSDLQKAFSFWSIPFVYGQDISPKDNATCFEKAVQYDPVNNLYKLAQANALAEAGQLQEASALLSSLTTDEAQQPDWSPSCLRQTCRELRLPDSRAVHRLILSNFDALAAHGSPSAALCLALTSDDPVRIAELTRTIKASDWPVGDFFTHALTRRLNEASKKAN